MIKINIVEGEQPKTITADKLSIGMWYPIHIGDIKGDLMGFVQYLGGMSYVYIIGNNNPETGFQDDVIGQLSLVGGVLINKPATIDVQLDAEHNTSTFKGIPVHGVFSVGDRVYMKISDEHAIMHCDEGRVAKFRNKTRVIPMSKTQGGDKGFDMVINYAV